MLNHLLLLFLLFHRLSRDAVILPLWTRYCKCDDDVPVHIYCYFLLVNSSRSDQAKSADDGIDDDVIIRIGFQFNSILRICAAADTDVISDYLIAIIVIDQI